MDNSSELMNKLEVEGNGLGVKNAVEGASDESKSPADKKQQLSLSSAELEQKLVNKSVPSVSGNSSVGTSEQEGEVKPWKPFRLVSHDIQCLPTAVMQLFSVQTRNGGISIMEYASTLANLSMIETGFVPIHGDDADVRADELMQVPVQRRMNQLIDTLSKIVRDRENVMQVFYKYLIRVSTDGRPDNSSFIYGEELLKLTVWHNLDTFIELTSQSGDREVALLQINMAPKYIQPENIWKPLSVSYIMERFNSDAFMCDIKCKLCGTFIDKFLSYSPELIGFRMLPTEMIIYLSKFLDSKSFVHLLMTCTKTRSILDDEALWENLCQRIPRDFEEYGLTAPSKEQLRSRLADYGPSVTFREKYRRIYQDAVGERRRRAQRQRLLFGPEYHMDLMFPFHPFL